MEKHLVLVLIEPSLLFIIRQFIKTHNNLEFYFILTFVVTVYITPHYSLVVQQIKFSTFKLKTLEM